jgi:RNA polymerase sigma factor (sigma-70 family)
MKEESIKDFSVSSRPILSRIASGDHSAFRECVERYGSLVWSVAKRLTTNHNDAEDAVQEIFLEIWQKAGKWDPNRSAETTFITMIARRKLIDRFRKSSRSLETTSMGPEHDIEVSASGNPIEILDESEKAHQCLGRLGETHREVIRRTIHLGHSHSLIARQLGLPVGTVKTYARRSLIQLRNCMEQHARTRGNS